MSDGGQQIVTGLIKEYRQLQLELEEATALKQSYQPQFIIEVIPSGVDLSLAFGDPVKTEASEEIDMISSASLKKLYVKIALKVHPDRVNESTMPGSNEMMQAASRAYACRDIVTLLDLAAQLPIDVPELSQEDIRILHLQCQSKRKQIEGVKTDVMYVWGRGASAAEEREISKWVRHHFTSAVVKKSIVQSKDNATCIVCAGTIKFGLASTLRCGHQFHVLCLDAWFLLHFYCPACKKI